MVVKQKKHITKLFSDKLNDIGVDEFKNDVGELDLDASEDISGEINSFWSNWPQWIQWTTWRSFALKNEDEKIDQNEDLDGENNLIFRR